MNRKASSYAIMALFVLAVFPSCGKEGGEKKTLEVTPEEISLYVDGKKALSTNTEDATFSSRDEFYATVDEGGLVKANKVGETEIVVSSGIGTLSVPVKVMSSYTLHPDLDGLIGKKFPEVTDILGTSYSTSESKDGEIYTFPKPTSYVAGIIVNVKEGSVYSIGVVVPTSNTAILTKSLIERYTVAGKQNGMYFFLNHDRDVVIGLEVYNTSYLLALYMEYTPTKSLDLEEVFSSWRDSFPGL